MKTLLTVVLALLFLASPVQAAWHLYVTPYVAFNDRKQPDFNGIVVPKWAAFRFGAQPIALVAADVNAATDAALAAQPNITKLPDNLDQQVGAGALNAVQNALENRNIPGNWVTATTTYRTIVRVVAGGFTLLQRYRSISGNLTGPVLTGSVTLNTTFGSLPLAARNDLIATANSLALDTSGFTGASTLRQILKGVGDQFAAKPFVLGGITI